ncbi:three component ABC system middle component [Sphingobium rhizovicinum]|uniref:Three component ABC system middle component n=1 Tax=Sphingobium rhizovicinum TaxID=432308 RepID=A0ABV7NML7_9SPHN
MTAFASATLTELDLVQNPAIGAYLIWNFTLGYQEDGPDAVPVLLAFLLLPMLLHRQTFEAVASTRKTSGLTLFAAKFDREREALVELHSRARLLRPLTLQSIGVASTSRLIRIDHGSALMRGYPLDLLEVKKPAIPERLKGFPAAADKVGYWFSKLGLPQIASTLRVDF